MTNKENIANNRSHKKLYNKQSSIPRLNGQKVYEDIRLFNFSISCILSRVLHSKLLQRTIVLYQRIMTKRNLNPKSKWYHACTVLPAGERTSDSTGRRGLFYISIPSTTLKTSPDKVKKVVGLVARVICRTFVGLFVLKTRDRHDSCKKQCYM